MGHDIEIYQENGYRNLSQVDVFQHLPGEVP
jgi:hypothetical protein